MENDCAGAGRVRAPRWRDSERREWTDDSVASSDVSQLSTQVFNLLGLRPGQRTADLSALEPTEAADYKSAIQQIKNLRYVSRCRGAKYSGESFMSRSVPAF